MKASGDPPRITADWLKAHLGLVPLPEEGGYYRETYRSPEILPASKARPASGSPRSLSTAIYYLLTPETFSALHRLAGDEVYHFYLGDPVELVELYPDGRGAVAVLGSDLKAGMRLQQVVQGGTWQGARLVPGGAFGLLGTTMAPGFDREDFELGRRDMLEEMYPAMAAWVALLTR